MLKRQPSLYLWSIGEIESYFPVTEESKERNLHGPQHESVKETTYSRTDFYWYMAKGCNSLCSHMKKDKPKIDGYTRGELAQLARRKMTQQVVPSKKKYKRNKKDDEERYI